MDLAKIKAVEKAEAGFWMPLIFVDGTELDTKFLVAGIDSRIYLEKQREIANRRIEYAQKNRKKKISREEIEGQDIELLATCIIDWKNVEYNEKPLDCTLENKIMVLTENAWVREQIDVAIGDRRNFLSL